MAKARMDLTAFVGKLLAEQNGDVLREWIRVLSQALMETEVAGLIGAKRHGRTGERVAYRNGNRTRMWDTRMGTIELAIPKVTPCTYVPSLLQPRRRAEHACAVVQEAYVHGVSTRKVDALVKALGVAGISTSEVSRICGELDTVVSAFRTRPLTGQHRYLWVDATYHKVRVAGRVISHATVPGAFHAESIGHGAARGAGGDRGRRPHDLCAAGPRLGDDATAEGRRRPDSTNSVSDETGTVQSQSEARRMGELLQLPTPAGSVRGEDTLRSAPREARMSYLVTVHRGRIHHTAG